MFRSESEFRKAVKAGLKSHAQQQTSADEAKKHPLHDELFGRLDWEPHSCWLEGKACDEQGREFTFSIEAENNNDRKISEQTRELFKRYLPQIETIRVHAAEEEYRQVIELFGKADFSVTTLLECLVPDHFRIRANGDLEISYADSKGEVFSGGHQLTARYKINGYFEVVLDG